MRRVKAEVGGKGRRVPPSKLEVRPISRPPPHFPAPALTPCRPFFPRVCPSRAEELQGGQGPAVQRPGGGGRGGGGVRKSCVTVPSQPLELTVFTLETWQHRCSALCPTRNHSPLRGSVPATPINLPLSTCTLSYSQHPQGPSQFPQLPRLEFCSRHQCVLPVALPLTSALGLAEVPEGGPKSICGI